MILSPGERVTAALGDLLVEIFDQPVGDIDEDALAREIEAGFRG